MKSSNMFPVSSKRSRQNNQDKQNIQGSLNVNDAVFSSTSNIKTGIQIRNKIKNRDILKDLNINKKLPNRKNNHLLQHLLRKKCKTKGQNSKKSCNLSSTSTTRSIKSVTFSVDSASQTETARSQDNKKSILKNRYSNQNELQKSEKKSLASSLCSHLKGLDQSVQNQNSNNIILQKYQKIMRELKLTKQKYTDTIYPPYQQSIFLKNNSIKDLVSKLSSEGFKIKWMRLGQIYKSKDLCIWHPEHKSRITGGFINSNNQQNNYVQTVLNAINKNNLMEKYFESQKISQEGIYYIKMHQTQTKTWKYVVIDDFIPVLVSNMKNQGQKIIKPAFLNVQSESQIIQIWPYLLQKAYAKYYSTFDSLIKGNTLDFLQQVTGNFYKTVTWNSFSDLSRQEKMKIDRSFRNQFNVMVAQTQDGFIYPFKTKQEQFYILDIENQYQQQIITKQHFFSFFSKVHIIQANKYCYQINSLIKQQSLLEKQVKEIKKPFILRSLNLKQSSECLIVLTQKQQRFHRSYKIKQYSLKYNYSWMRMILVMKQTTGYRWIQSSYLDKKSLKIQAVLGPGQYFIIILPQWNSKPYDVNLTISSNIETSIQRKSYNDHLNIIEESCMDLAQRYGKLIQINHNICSYNYIDYKIGFIIQNINNQNNTGQVKILRTIDGLDNYNITPINADFYHSKRLQIRIKSLQSCTVVLKVSGGVDKAFLAQFDFGS